MNYQPNDRILPRFLHGGESWDALVDRVSSVGKRNEPMCRELIKRGVVVPAGQILRGAGLDSKVLHNCFVTGSEAGERVEDIASRITAWTRMGAGVGVNLDGLFGDARAVGIPTTEIVLSIARSQQTLWDSGITRTATMITMRATDPDAAKIARMLAEVTVCRHLNLGVLATDEDMTSFTASGDMGVWRGPLSILASAAWHTGNPGILFTDRIARDHPFDEQILACNPCAEQHLAAEEGCALASINLAALCHKSSFDWTGLRDATRATVRFLDDIIDEAAYPDARTARRAAERRRVGVGVMGFATALHSLGIEYGSADSIALTNEFSATMRSAAHAESRYLALLRGAFPDAALDGAPHRNSHLLSIAPTGAISLLWNVSSGIEPYFDLKIAKESLDVSYDLRTQGRPKLAREIPASRHINVLAAWQVSVDGGISKTVNLPEHSTPNDVCQTITSAWRSGCKGVSVFRAGSRSPALKALS